ncbi:MAG: hypothetical protein KDD25_02335, partial [Bdellovibrionales bacterium]|nr:hypothetical protein [Bdellovibrionales bacterium]
MISSILNGINKKSMVIATIAVFIYIWISDFLIHGLLLSGIYKETAQLWRTEEDMQGHMLWMLIGQFLIAKFFTLVFIKGYNGGGVSEGLRFGLIAAPLLVAPNFITHAVMPIPANLIWMW